MAPLNAQAGHRLREEEWGQQAAAQSDTIRVLNESLKEALAARQRSDRELGALSKMMMEKRHAGDVEGGKEPGTSGAEGGMVYCIHGLLCCQK